jgi:hypothetical protein
LIINEILEERSPTFIVQDHINSGMYSPRKTAPEYVYINYDLDLVKREYERVDTQIAEMQIALDKYNQTFEFEVQI